MKFNMLSVCAVVASIVSASASANTVTIRADEWYPINGVPGSDKPGYMIELAQTILAPHGHTVEYRTMPWERSLTQVREGSFDCVVGAYKEDAPDFIFPGESWGSIESTFYVKKGSAWKYSGLKSLDAVVVATIGGYAYSDEFDKYVADNKSTGKVQVINANNGLGQNIKKLLAGRVGAVVESDLVMKAKLKSMGVADQVVPAGLLVAAEDMYIACSPAKSTSKAYVKLFTDGIKKMRASGKLKVLLNKYGLKDWK